MIVASVNCCLEKPEMSQRPERKPACEIFLNQRHVVIDKWWKVLLTLLTQLIDIFKRERFIHSFNRSTMCKVSLLNLKNCMKKL